MTKTRIKFLSSNLSYHDGAILCFLMGWYRSRPKSEFWRALEAAVCLYRPEIADKELPNGPPD